MQIIINVPDDWKTRIECNRRPNTIECGELIESIWKGKILPKGYGRLIDADAIEYTHAIVKCLDDRHNWNELCVTEDEIYDAPTIIEADRAESEEKE